MTSIWFYLLFLNHFILLHFIPWLSSTLSRYLCICSALSKHHTSKSNFGNIFEWTSYSAFNIGMTILSTFFSFSSWSSLSNGNASPERSSSSGCSFKPSFVTVRTYSGMSAESSSSSNYEQKHMFQRGRAGCMCSGNAWCAKKFPVPNLAASPGRAGK